MITETVERIRQPLDRHGDPDGEPEVVDIDDFYWWPADGNGTGTNENQNGQFDRVTIGRTGVAPYGADIQPADKIQFGDGSVWNVEGEKADWQSPFTGWQPGTVVSLRRFKG